ncbi:MAG: ribosomal protein S18-alanine N-acetyltransferase [Nitrospirae bacterium]|nr:ribosomal protein S18-alanine N-acetyltransferase [Nitrospirota bacterium]
MEGIIIREMSSGDLPEVHALEDQCYSTPWSINSFKHELQNKDAILKAAVLNHHIIGYVCVRTILDMTHLLNLAVSPEFRRKGVGSMLLLEVIKDLKRLKPGIKLTLEVRQSNTAAVKLYEGFGFKATGKRTGYYQKPHDDAVIMELDIN